MWCVCVCVGMCVGLCVCEGGGGRRRRRPGGGPGYRIKNKNPTQRCGEPNSKLYVSFRVSMLETIHSLTPQFEVLRKLYVSLSLSDLESNSLAHLMSRHSIR